MKSKTFHLLKYVENTQPKIKLFETLKAMYAFKNKFERKHPGKGSDGWWVEFAVTHITGNLIDFDECYKV